MITEFIIFILIIKVSGTKKYAHPHLLIMANMLMKNFRRLMQVVAQIRLSNSLSCLKTARYKNSGTATECIAPLPIATNSNQVALAHVCNLEQRLKAFQAHHRRPLVQEEILSADPPAGHSLKEAVPRIIVSIRM